MSDQEPPILGYFRHRAARRRWYHRPWSMVMAGIGIVSAGMAVAPLLLYPLGRTGSLLIKPAADPREIDEAKTACGERLPVSTTTSLTDVLPQLREGMTVAEFHQLTGQEKLVRMADGRYFWLLLGGVIFTEIEHVPPDEPRIVALEIDYDVGEPRGPDH